MNEIVTYENVMKLNGRDAAGDVFPLTIAIAPDLSEVRGFGKPITQDAADQMINAYADEVELVTKFIDQKLGTFRGHPELGVLTALLSPAAQTVSGVFGKEIIMQILAQKNCEGIRYVVGRDTITNKNTIILLGVTESPEEAVEDNPAGTAVNAKSKAITGRTMPESTGAINYIMAEVHGNSLTLQDVYDLKTLNNSAADILLGTY